MAISRITGQDFLGSSLTNSVTVTYPGATTSGNLLIAVSYSGSSSVPSVSGWTEVSQGINSNTAQMTISYKIADGTETSITATCTTSSLMRLHLYEYTGNANPVDLDVAFVGNGTTTGGTSWTTSSITTTDANDLIFGVVGVNGGAGTQAWSGLNVRQIDTRMWEGDLIPGSIQTNFTGTATWTGTLKPSAIIGAFKAASGGGSAPAVSHANLPLMGVG